MLEEFFHDAQLLASFARHYQTGEPIPPAAGGTNESRERFGRADGVRTQLFYTSYRARRAQPASANARSGMRFSSKVTSA